MKFWIVFSPQLSKEEWNITISAFIHCLLSVMCWTIAVMGMLWESRKLMNWDNVLFRNISLSIIIISLMEMKIRYYMISYVCTRSRHCCKICVIYIARLKYITPFIVFGKMVMKSWFSNFLSFIMYGWVHYMLQTHVKEFSQSSFPVIKKCCQCCQTLYCFVVESKFIAKSFPQWD